MVMRAGKVGYRTVMANHAFAYHAGSASFMLHDMDLKGQQQGNLQKMNARHPEFLPLVWDFEASADYRTELKIRPVGSGHGGKLKIALNLLTFGKAPQWHERAYDAFRYFALVRQDGARQFRNLCHLRTVGCQIPRDRRAQAHSGPPRIMRRITRSRSSLVSLSIAAIFNVMEHPKPINIYGMLDVIALDCSLPARQ